MIADHVLHRAAGQYLIRRAATRFLSQLGCQSIATQPLHLGFADDPAFAPGRLWRFDLQYHRLERDKRILNGVESGESADRSAFVTAHC